MFGAVAMIQAVLPVMRQRRAGHILNITSMGGIITLPGLSYYHGSKFALEGISEALGKEVKDLGINVTRSTRRLSHRLGRALHGAGGAIDPGLRRADRADPQAPHGGERLADRRSRQGGAGDAEGRDCRTIRPRICCWAATPCGWSTKR